MFPDPLHVEHLILPAALHCEHEALRFVPLQAVQVALTCVPLSHVWHAMRLIPAGFGQVPYSSPNNPFLTIAPPSHRGQVIFPSWQDEHFTVIWPVESQRVQRQLVQSRLLRPLQLGHES